MPASTIQLSTLSIPTLGIQHTQEKVNTTVETSDLGSGTLYITENNVVWLNSNNEGIQLEYKLISLHAISRDLQNFPKEHLLLHYEAKILGDSDSGAGSDEDEDEDDDEYLSEVRFAPETSEALSAMFEAMSTCQTLHPDSEDEFSEEDAYHDVDDEEAEGYFNSADGFDQLNEEGLANLARFNAMLSGSGGQPGGQGDADLAQQTQGLTLANGDGPHNGQHMEDEQFEDAEDMDAR